jgi:hypothetical protein
MSRRILVVVRSTVILVALAAAASCLVTPRDACHERMMAAHGCCPFHGDDCDVTLDVVEEACDGVDESHDPALLVDGEPEEKPPADGEPPRPE